MRISDKKKSILWLIAILSILPLWAQNRGKNKTDFFQGKEAATNEVLVKFRPTTFQSVLEAQAAGEVDESEWVGGTGLLRLHSSRKNVATLVSELSARSDVEYAEPNYIVHTTAIPNDPRFGELWGLQNTGQIIQASVGVPGADIKATAAWDISTGSRANVAAVIDTGIDYRHPDLAANVWSAPAAFTVTIGGQSITCPAGSHGFNAITNVCDPLDDNNHGSHVSGTIGAVGNNGTGVVGVNWTASIMGSKFINASGSGTTANAINAIEFAVQTKAAFAATGGANVRVLSNSWGGGAFSQALLDEINRANANDMLFVAAAGNSGTPNDLFPEYPASYNAPNVVAVAATDNTDSLAFFSNYGPSSVHLGAPGVDVLSTTVGSNYAYLSGTSMATPHVSGAALLVLSKCALNTASLKTLLLNNVDPIPSLTGLTATGGRLNVSKAIRACAAPANPEFALSATPASQTVTQGGSTTYTVNISPSGGFTGAVSLSAAGLPTGASASFSPNPATASSAMTVGTGAATPPGSYPLTITGVSGTLTRTTSVTLAISPAPVPDFSLSATPASQSVVQGAGTTYTVSITPSGGFTAAVIFTVSGLPGGATVSFSPNPTTASSTMTVGTGAATPPGNYAMTITGISGTLARTTSVTLTVNLATVSDFSLSATPASQTIVQGAGTTYAVSITPSGGFTAAVTFSVSGLPGGATASFSPNPANASSTMIVGIGATTSAGNYALTITGVSGTLTHTTSVTLVVIPRRPSPLG
jgi:subtilisin family serine protease